MNCQQIRNRLDAWVDGELSAPMAAAVTRHLEGCPSCRRHALERQQMAGALDRLPLPKAPADLSRRTLRAFRAGIRRRAWPSGGGNSAWSCAAPFAVPH